MRPSAGCLAVLLLVLSSRPLAAQRWVADTAVKRLAWGSVNVLVRADAAGGVRLWAETSSLGYSGQPLAFVASFDPDSVDQWLDRAQMVTRYKTPPSGDSVAALQTPPLRAPDSSQVILLRRRNKAKWANHATLLFVDPAERHPWSIEAKLDEMNRFIQVFFHQASRSGWHPAIHDSTRVYEANPTVEATCPVRLPGNPGLVYPVGLYGISGAVWMTFVVRADGTPDEASFRAMLFDHPAFAEAAFQALRRTRYKPGTLNGQPVAMLVSQKVLFKNDR